MKTIRFGGAGSLYVVGNEWTRWWLTVFTSPFRVMFQAGPIALTTRGWEWKGFWC